MTTSLFEHTRRHVEKAMLDVTGDDDFLPLMALRDHKGDLVVAGLVMPEDNEKKYLLAWTMSALCAMHRATEVAFTSVAWIVERDAKKGEEWPDLPPSQCPDRREVAMISVIDADDNASLHAATVIRENNLVGVGLWEGKGSGKTSEVHSGRFVDAIRTGMDMGRRMPPDLAEYVDAQVAAGNSDRLIQLMVSKLQQMKDQNGGVQN